MKYRFDPREGLIAVPTRIRGPRRDIVVFFALDTGATYTLVNWDIALAVGHDPGAKKNRYRITTGSGVEFVPKIAVNEIEALGQKRRNFPILCHTLPPSATVDGLLGLDFLRKHKLKIDFREGTLVLE